MAPKRRQNELRQARGIKETSQLLPVEDPFQQRRRWMVGARPPRSSPRSQKTTRTCRNDSWQGDAAGEVQVWGFPALPWEAPNLHPWLPSPPGPITLMASLGRVQEQPRSPLLTHLCGCLGGRASGKRCSQEKPREREPPNSSGSFLWLVVYIAPAPSRLLP